MKVHILQHTDETTPGLTLDWLRERKQSFGLTRFFLGESLPKIDDFDFLVICGGGMGAYEEKKYEWLKAEKELIKNSIENEKVVVGLCLGAQLIASSLGAEVKKHEGWEIGWHDVEIKNSVNAQTEKLKVFQYHQDTFSLPPRAELFATNEFCKNQGFTIGEKVIGVQFHPEASAEWVKELAEDPDFPSGEMVQRPIEMISDTRFMPQQKQWYFDQLDRLAEKI